MAYKVSKASRDFLTGFAPEPTIIFTIDGIPLQFGAQIVKVVSLYGGGASYGDPDLLYGGNQESGTSKDYIVLSGTTQSFSQQIEPDKLASSSAQRMTIRVQDQNEEITKVVTPGFYVPDVLYRDAYVSLLPGKDLAFPDDAIEMFNGKIQQITTGPNYIDFVISHPEDLKRSEIFLKAETSLTAPAYFNAAEIQDLTYFARGDVAGAVTITYTNTGLGQNPIVSVIGNDITVEIEPGVTFAKSIKKAVENDEDANQLVTVRITGSSGDVQTVQSTTQLQSTTTISVEDVSQFLLPVPGKLQTYCRIGNEIIQYTSVNLSGNQLTGCTRARLSSLGENHSVDDEVSSFYVLGGSTFDTSNAIDLTLWLLLSSGPETYYQTEVKSFQYINDDLSVTNAVYIEGEDLGRFQGVTAGDTCSTSGATAGANNFTDNVISNVVKVTNGTYLVIDGVNLVEELDSPATISFKSKYNVLPSGCGVGLLPNQVDIQQFEYLKKLYTSNILTFEFYLKDTINAADFIAKEIFQPSGLYSIPRKGRVSVGFTAPPLYSSDTKTINLTNVLSPASIKIDRSVTSNFYNSVVFRFNEDSIEDVLLSGRVTYSADSTARISAPNKPTVIEAKGLRPSATNLAKIDRISARLLDRYKYGAQSVAIEVPFSIGWNAEVGDAMVFGDPDLKLVDINSGSRAFKPRIWEIQSKEMNWKTCDLKFFLVDTSYDQNVRYAVWSPTSKVLSGTTSTVKIQNSYGYTLPELERDKWEAVVGRSIIVRNADRSSVYQTKLISFSDSDPFTMNVSPPLPAPPANGWFVDIPNYDDIPDEDDVLKSIYPFWTPQVGVIGGTSQTEFTVESGKGSLFFEGSILRVVSEDYSIDSGRTGIRVESVAGDVITLESELGFVPSGGLFVELIGFVSDEGAPYVWV